MESKDPISVEERHFGIKNTERREYGENMERIHKATDENSLKMVPDKEMELEM